MERSLYPEMLITRQIRASRSSYQPAIKSVSVAIVHTSKRTLTFSFHIFQLRVDVATETINITVIDLNDNEPKFVGDYSLIEARINIQLIRNYWQWVLNPVTDLEHARPQSAEWCDNRSNRCRRGGKQRHRVQHLLRLRRGQLQFWLLDRRQQWLEGQHYDGRDWTWLWVHHFGEYGRDADVLIFVVGLVVHCHWRTLLSRQRMKVWTTHCSSTTSM